MAKPWRKKTSEGSRSREENKKFLHNDLQEWIFFCNFVPFLSRMTKKRQQNSEK